MQYMQPIFDGHDPLDRARVSCGAAATVLDDGRPDLAEKYLFEAVARLREASGRKYLTGLFEGEALRVYGTLANLLVPKRISIEIADELVDVISAGRAHPMDVAEALAIRAEVLSQVGTVDDAIAAAREVVRRSEGVCFHLESAKAELAIAERLRAEGRLDEALEWEVSGAHRTDEEVPGHTHLWNIQIDVEGNAHYSDSGEIRYDDPVGRQPGSARDLQ